MENIQDKIAARAFELFEIRGGQDGYHIQDWLQAENELADASAPGKKSVAKAAASAPVKEKKAVAPKAKVVKAAPAKKVAAKK